MLNIRELEKKWLIYKIKSYIPHLIISVSLIIIISLLTLFINKKDDFKSSTKEKKALIKKEMKIPLKTISKPTVAIPPIKKEKKALIKKEPTPKLLIVDSETLTLKPSLGFMKKIQNSTLPYYQSEPSYANMTTKMKQEVDIAKEKTQQEALKKPSTIVHKKKEDYIQQGNKITIERRNTREDINNIIKRFKKNNNPALSLFIAKKYYELGEYHKSYNYALITNQINRDIEASWLVFSKSLMKLGERKMAIKTLKEYIKSSHSSNAKLLLEDINSGKFR